MYLRSALLSLSLLLLLSVQASADPIAMLSGPILVLRAKPGQIEPGDMTLPVGQATNVECGGTITMAGTGGYFTFTANYLRIGKVDDYEPSKWAIVKRFSLPSKEGKQDWVRIWKTNKYQFGDNFWLPWTPKQVGDYQVQCSLDGGYENGGTIVSSHEIHIGEPLYTDHVLLKTIHVTAPPPPQAPTIQRVTPNHFPIGGSTNGSPSTVRVFATSLDMYEFNHVTIGGIAAVYSDRRSRFHYGQGYVAVYVPDKVLKAAGTYTVRVKTRGGLSQPYEIAIGPLPKPPSKPRSREGLEAPRRPQLPTNSTLHLSTEQPSPGKTALHLPPPNIKVVRETNRVDKTCADVHRLIEYTVTVRNEGGPLPTHRWSLRVTEAGGAGLASGGVWVPPLTMRTEGQVSIPVAVSESHIAQLPGTHILNLISLDNQTGRKTTTRLRPITLGGGICQSRMHISPLTGIHLQPATTHRGALRPAPIAQSPESAKVTMHKIGLVTRANPKTPAALPAVQLPKGWISTGGVLRAERARLRLRLSGNRVLLSKLSPRGRLEYELLDASRKVIQRVAPNEPLHLLANATLMIQERTGARRQVLLGRIAVGARRTASRP